ncbi:MAG: DUF6477 family protein [Paracoccaceae bacterium]
MQNIVSRLEKLRRPSILTRAAQQGALSYSRKRHLQRVLGYGTLPKTPDALPRLLDMEEELERQRTDDFAGYSAVRHLDVLIATVAEAQIFRALKPTLSA